MIAISLNGVTLSFGMRTVLENISFSLNEDDKLGIVGVNGCGKSSLFRLILGEEEADCGEIYISKDKTLGILRQDGAFTLPEGLSDDAKPAEVMLYSYPELLETEARLDEMKRRLDAWSGVSDNSFYTELSQKYTDLHAKYIADGGMEFRSRCVSVLRRMGFDDEMLSRPVATLSGGQKTRLAISVQLCRDPDILLLDEPTNHLDIETLGWLENYLASYKKCVLVISHDRYFLDRVTFLSSTPRASCLRGRIPPPRHCARMPTAWPKSIIGSSRSTSSIRRSTLPSRGRGTARRTSSAPRAARRCLINWSAWSARRRGRSQYI